MVWFVASDLLEWGTYTHSLERAMEIKKGLISSGGVDAKIEYDPWKN